MAIQVSAQPRKPTVRPAGPLQFTFEARAKPQVTVAMQAEDRRMKRIFSRKPKVGLRHMEQHLAKRVGLRELARYDQKFTDYYYGDDDASLYFEALGRLYLEAASKETSDQERQMGIIFRALDALSIAIQKSPKAINVSAQSVIVAISRLLGPAYQQTASAEYAVHQEMIAMINVKKDLNDFSSREKLYRLYQQGQRFYEAIVHMAEYEKIMLAKSRPLYQQKKGEMAYRKATIFQQIIDYYMTRQRTQDEGGSDKPGDMNKLASFITRFNRDNRRYNIIPLAGNSALALQKTMGSMVTIANGFFQESSHAVQFAHRYKAYFQIARNHQMFENPRNAIHALGIGLKEIDDSRLPLKLKAQEKVKFYEFQQAIYKDMGLERKVEELQKEIARLNKEAREAPAVPKVAEEF